MRKQRFCFDCIYSNVAICSIKNVTRKMYVMLMVLNEEKQKLKKRSLFGGTVKDNTKSYCIYKNSDRDFESVAVLFTGKEEN